MMLGCTARGGGRVGDVIDLKTRTKLKKPQYDAQAYDVTVLVLKPETQTVRVIANSMEEAVRAAFAKFSDEVCTFEVSTVEVAEEGGQA